MINANKERKMTVPFIEVNDDVRAKKCMQAIQGILAQFDCALIPRVTMPVLGPEDINFRVVANPRTPKPEGKDVSKG